MRLLAAFLLLIAIGGAIVCGALADALNSVITATVLGF